MVSNGSFLLISFFDSSETIQNSGYRDWHLVTKHGAGKCMRLRTLLETSSINLYLQDYDINFPSLMGGFNILQALNYPVVKRELMS